MFKTRLQELCHQRLWPAPDYTVSRDGPGHDPRFRASVTVNGVNFHAPDVSKSSKEAQSKAAQVAIDHFAANPPLKPSPQTPVLVESQTSYKAQLQIYAQKNNIGLPKYDAVREGYIHAALFKANVTVDGQTFYSKQFFSTLKEAEGDAAKVALSSFSLGENQNPQNNSSFYKNLLQELATKEGMSLPKYRTVNNGACHMPIFSSTVETGGESFVGDVAKTKKQAEMNAAMVAWFKLKERLNTDSGRASLSSSCLKHESLKPDSPGSQSNDIRNLELPKSPSISPSHVKLNHKEENPGLNTNSGRTSLSSSCLKNERLKPDSPGSQSKDIRNLELPKSPSISPSHVKLNHKEENPGLNTNSGRASLSSSCLMHESPKPGSPGSQSKDIRNLELPKSPSISSSHVKLNHEEENPGKKLEDEILLKHRSGTVVKTTSFPDYQGPYLTKETSVNVNVHTKKMAAYNKLDAEVPMNKEVIVEDSISQDGTLTPSSTSDCSDHPVADVISESPLGRACSSLLCNRVRVFPRKPNMLLPKGAISLPFSDDMWVAVSLNFSNHEDVYDKGITAEIDSDTVSVAPILHDDQGTHSKEIMLNGNGHSDKSDLSLHNDIEVMEDILSEEETSSSMESACNDLFIVDDVNSETPMGGGACSLQRNRVRVHPNKPDMVLPEGAFRLPFSDDKWVAVSMDF